jgi:hypothetical protein
MVNRKSPEEKLQELERKRAQLNNRIKALDKAAKEKKRKERTHRLIQLGALSEKYFNCENANPEDYEILLLQIIENQNIQDIINQKKPE